eukprot:TRINITY_DN16385_c0_g1_i1.p1 TRINITY_DN16385_c0_g1~~TRINITY_DN16385_c0_g1_i1.p1  ORF type:complete len:411 (+),score=79.66 TRINITY_DN16385_c0_g1_i1:58-1290(+)
MKKGALRWFQVFSWGSGWNGRTGHNTRQIQRSPQLLEYLEQLHIVKLALKSKHMLALSEDGSVYAWGSNDYGQLGLGNSQDRFLGQLYDHHMPMKVEGLPKISDIAAGWTTSAAIDEDGSLWMWGSNSRGQLATSSGGESAPVRVPGFGAGEASQVIQVALGAQHTAAVDESGNLWTWGNDDYGRLGHGSPYAMKLGTKVNVPTRVVASIGDGQEVTFTSASCGAAHTLAIADSGQVFAFGQNRRQQLGCDTGSHVTRTQQFDCTYTPMLVPMLASLVSASDTYSCGIDKEGHPLVWGGSIATPELQRRAGNKPFKARIADMACGLNHTGMVTEAGRLYMTGKNTFGELGVEEVWYRQGNPLAGKRVEPVAVTEVLRDYNVVQVVCGNRCTAVLAHPRVEEAEGDESTAS